jgi:perosamine synthetase
MIRLIMPYISFAEVEKDFKKAFDTGILTKGSYVESFREELKKYTGSLYAFLATSATTALSMSLKLLNICPGDEVVVSDFSFPASANVIEDLGAIPIFADVNLETFNATAATIEQKITNRTKAVMFVDALGNPSGISEVLLLCKHKGIPLIEDAACAIGSSENGVRCGNISDLTCFSFHPRKLLTTGEGGAITSNHKKYAEILDVKLNHGSVVRNGKFDFIDYGYNFRLPELQAIMGIKQIQKLNSIISDRNNIRQEYLHYLEPMGFKPQKVADQVIYNVQSLAFIVPKRISRDTLIAKLKERGVESTIGTYCLSGTTYYKSKYNTVQPNALFLQENTITLPCFNGLDVTCVCHAIQEIC